MKLSATSAKKFAARIERAAAVQSDRPTAEQAPPEPSADWSGYSGADVSSLRRGQVWWPTLDTRLEIDSFTREELIRRSRWLVGNVGMARRLARGLPELVGVLTPQAGSTDETWNSDAEASFRRRMGSSIVFDAAGKLNFWSAQLAIQRCALRDGDILTILSETASQGAMFAFYEAHQLKNPADPVDAWRDGVRIDRKTGRHVAYGIREPKAKTSRVIGARDVIYFGDPDSPGNIRALPPLAPAINHALDITEVWADWKHAIKTSALFGAIRTKKENTPTAARSGLPGAYNTRSTGTAANGGNTFETAEVYNGGQIPLLDPGEDMKTMHDERPHPNQSALVETLIRDISWGLGLPPEVTWQMSGLTGPGVRFVLALADRWIEQRQRHLQAWCERVWVYFIAKEMKAGRLREPSDGQWARVARWVPQRSLTIDRGRESAAWQAELRGGMTTLSDWYSATEGADWQEKLRQRHAEVRYIKDLCGDPTPVTYEDIIQAQPGTAPRTDTPADTTTPPTTPD